MKTGPDALATAKNMSWGGKHKNMKKGPDALVTAENEFGGAKNEKVT
jgi:hypothetical protein